MKIHARITIVVVITALIFISNFLLREDKSFKILNCQSCSVLRITESVYNGPVTKARSDKIWEINAKPGIKSANSNWSLIIKSSSNQVLAINLTGNIYREMKPIINPVILDKWNKAIFDDRRSGGGTVWEFLYYDK